MSISDIVVMLIGIILIAIGLYLFVSGKKESSQNHVEGFGIKLNVSNPSVILIIVGVGLLVLPRFFPDDIDQNNKPKVVERKAPEEVEPRPINNSPTRKISAQPLNTKPNLTPSNPNVQEANFPLGTWQLASYQENGIDYLVPAQITANLSFSNHSGRTVNWHTQVWVRDDFGNENYAQFKGEIVSQNGNYFISFLQGTSEEFIQEHDVPLDIYMEDGGLLHMEYISEGSLQIVHWRQ